MKWRIPNRVGSMDLWQIDAAGAVVVCLVAAAWYAAGLRPLNEARAAREDLEATLAAQRAVAQDKGKLAAMQERKLQGAGEQIAACEIRLEPVKQINAHMSRLSDAATAAGLRIDEIKPASPVPLARFTTVPIRLSGAGDYEAVTSFFRTLRSWYRDTGVTGFRLRAMESGAGTELQFELNLVWYAAPKPGTAKK